MVLDSKHTEQLMHSANNMRW